MLLGFFPTHIPGEMVTSSFALISFLLFLKHSVEKRHFSPSSFRKDSKEDSQWAEWVMWLVLSQSVWSGGWVCKLVWL